MSKKIRLIISLVLFAFIGIYWLIFQGQQQSKKQAELTELEVIESTLTQAEKDILAEIDFEEEIALRLKDEFKTDFERSTVVTYSYNIETEEFTETVKVNNGISFKVDEHDFTGRWPFGLTKTDYFNDQGYMIYRSQMNFGYEKDEVTILKTNDQFDILRAAQTEAPNYDLTNKDIIEKLKSWNRTTPFTIHGAGHDWVEAQFDRLPSDTEAIANKVFKFAPDVVYQGAETVENLAESMEFYRQLYLWWD